MVVGPAYAAVVGSGYAGDGGGYWGSYVDGSVSGGDCVVVKVDEYVGCVGVY